MKKKYTLTLDNEFIDYCKLNNIEDVDKLAKETFSKGFSILKYGDTPKLLINKEETIKKWEESGFLDGIKKHNPDNVLSKLYESNPKQVINEAPALPKKNDNLYDE